ncbi:hypothetical protein IWX91DRAFT_116588 [Phyllosticta citricarpa]
MSITCRLSLFFPAARASWRSTVLVRVFPSFIFSLSHLVSSPLAPPPFLGVYPHGGAAVRCGPRLPSNDTSLPSFTGPSRWEKEKFYSIDRICLSVCLSVH